MLYAVEDIRQVHLEISSECNATCPQCPRNLCGYPHNDGYEEHSMTVAEAHPALISFILSAQANGLRLVLVITGKGKDRDDGGPIPTRYGVLRHQVPQWLHLAPCRQAVMQVTPAHQRHGGHGAYYVYLRRR